MSKDEEKAIEELEILATYDIESAFPCVFAEKDAKNVFTVLNIIKKQQRELKIKNEYFQLIHDLGYDFDGANTLESFKNLVTELVNYANKGYKADDKAAIYLSGKGKYQNILYEEIEGEPNNDRTNI